MHPTDLDTLVNAVRVWRVSAGGRAARTSWSRTGCLRAAKRLEGIRGRVRKPAIAALVTTFYAITFIGIAAEQVSDTQIRRFGTIGRGLSESEVTQIARLANAEGNPPWLVLGFTSMISGVTKLTVCLHPDVTSERLRRGRLLRLVAKDAPTVSGRSEWTVEERASYAYVPLAESAGEIASERDLAWPFAVHGEIDDETLNSLVTFVRSRPPLPNIPEGSAPREVVSAPLLGVWRRSDTFIVALRTREDTAVFRVTVIKKNGQWLVAKWDSSVA